MGRTAKRTTAPAAARLSQSTLNIAKRLLADVGIADRMDYLASRWQDEREYEDIAEYGEAISADIAKVSGVSFVRMSTHPFGPVVAIEELEFLLYWKRDTLVLAPKGGH